MHANCRASIVLLWVRRYTAVRAQHSFPKGSDMRCAVLCTTYQVVQAKQLRIQIYD